MMRASLLYFFIFKFIYCETLWPKGVVHYDVNKKDYDLHSQDVISDVLGKIEKEICIKFFMTPRSEEGTEGARTERILYISNPDKLKTCPGNKYYYNETVVNMPIGYKCLNEKDITRLVVDMIRASIDDNSIRLYQPSMQVETYGKTGLIHPEDKNYINSHYYRECSKLVDRPVILPDSRRMGEGEGKLTIDNRQYYAKKMWPLAIVNFVIDVGEDTELRAMEALLRDALDTFEKATCVEFVEADKNTQLPRAVLYFTNGTGEETPKQGYAKEKQVINLRNMTHGTPSHHAHVLLNLMRIIGFPLESNRVDRDDYVIIHWKNIEKGKEQFFELEKQDSFLHMPYDFDSVTHGPANYMCGSECDKGATTIQPRTDHMWLRTMTIGHKTELSAGDASKVATIYSHECEKRRAKKFVLRN